MKKVITYGTFDLLHYGHIRLLERAKALGDYLVVGITSDDYDKERGKINVQQSLAERMEAVRSTHIADEIIVEEYVGQKIDDIKRYDIDIFTVGSDWIGKFDYLNEFCEVVYLDRTKGVSSSKIRSNGQKLLIGIAGDELKIMDKYVRESSYVNGIKVKGICTESKEGLSDRLRQLEIITSSFDKLLENVDAIYLVTYPIAHYEQIKKALCLGKHVLCETPLTLKKELCEELYQIAQEHGCILMEAIKTAYSTAFTRLCLLLKTGKIGDIVSVEATCTSLSIVEEQMKYGRKKWGSMYSWAPYALLAVFSVLGVNYERKFIQTKIDEKDFDVFTKVDFIYKGAVAAIKVGNGVKSEGELIISGTKGYIYVPAPWWKMDYFEVRYENMEHNERYFYQLEGEGIRYMIVSFLRAVKEGKTDSYISKEITYEICGIIEDFENRKDTYYIS